MNKKFALTAIASTGVFLAACDGDNGLAGADGMDGMDGADGADGFNSLVATREIPKGDAVCLGGGLALDSGLDTNRNDVLDPGEVTATELLECNTAPRVRALHASPDAPAVNIWVNGAPALTDVDFGVGSGFLDGAEEVTVEVEGIFPGDDPAVLDEDAVVIAADLELDYNTDYSILAVNNVIVEGEVAIRPLIIANPTDELLTPGSFFAQVVHASPSAPDVDVYVTGATAALADSMPVNMEPLGFEEYTPRLEVPEGDYRIRVTLAGDTDTVVYDSGETPLSLAAGADLLIAALENVGLGDSAVQLVALDGAGFLTLLDAATPAAAVAVHLSPDAPAVDILADIVSTPNDEAVPLARNVAFTDFCVIEPITPESYALNVVASSDNGIPALPAPIPFDAVANGAATVIVSGFFSSGDPSITALPLAVDPRAVATEARVRLTHASPSTGNVDIYLLAPGTDLDSPDVTTELVDIPFGASTNVLSVAPGLYDVYITPAGDKSVRAIEVLDFPLDGFDVLDIVARDPGAEEGALPLPLVIDYDDLSDCTVALP